MKDRIRQVMIALHMNQQAFANYTGIKTSSLSSIFSGRTNPTLPHVEALMNSCPNLTLQWLLSGEGEIFINDGNTGSSTPPSSSSPSDSSSSGNGGSVSGSGSSSMVQSASTDKMTEQMLPFTDDIPAPSQNNRIGQNFGYGQNSHIPSPQQKRVVPITSNNRKITEIRIFYDDQTWESFVPKK